MLVVTGGVAMKVLKEWKIGAHHVQWEEPDVLRCTFRGPSSLKDIDTFLDILREAAANQRVFVIQDITGSTIDKACREHLSKNIRPEWLRGLIYVGADTVQRAIVKAIMIALYFTGQWKVDIEFASSEADARTIIAQKRKAQGPGASLRPQVVESQP
jgi:hypothetical protein